MVELLVVVAVVVFTSAACSLFEAVLYSVPISYVESMAQEGRLSGKILRRMRREVDRPIAAVLSLNTIANTAGASVAGALADAALGTRWIGLFSAMFTLVILIFSEILPKTTGVMYSRALAGPIALPLQALVWALSPLVWLSRLVTRLVGRRPDHSVSEEELLMMIRMGMQSGTIEENEARVIQNMLSLEARTVRDIMTPRTVMHALSCDATVREVRPPDAGLWPHSRVPVFDEDFEDVVGIVHRREVLGAMANDRWDVKLKELMKPVHFVVDSLSLDRLLRMFLERRQHIFVVIDEFGGVAGVVTLEDVLEEILGEEIVDEFDQVADMRELAHRRRRQTLDRFVSNPGGGGGR